MKQIITYLTFDGNCCEAMKFYQRCLGGDLHVTPFSEAPIETTAEASGRIIHATLKSGASVLMASDTMPGVPVLRGNNFSICIVPETAEETERLFSSLSENGKVTVPLQNTFWGARFGMLTDQFGINWMFNFEKVGSVSV